MSLSIVEVHGSFEIETKSTIKALQLGNNSSLLEIFIPIDKEMSDLFFLFFLFNPDLSHLHFSLSSIAEVVCVVPMFVVRASATLFHLTEITIKNKYTIRFRSKLFNFDLTKRNSNKKFNLKIKF